MGEKVAACESDPVPEVNVGAATPTGVPGQGSGATCEPVCRPADGGSVHMGGNGNERARVLVTVCAFVHVIVNMVERAGTCTYVCPGKGCKCGRAGKNVDVRPCVSVGVHVSMGQCV